MAEHDPQRSQLERLSEEYASLLGSETSTERAVKRVVPWVLSLAIHVTLIALAMAVTWSVTNLPKKDESILIVADFNALNYDPVAGFKAPQKPSGDRPGQDHAQSTPTDQAIRELLASGESDQDPMKLLGASAGGGSSADLSHFAPGPTRNGASFAGLSSSNARKIAYVIDASGSMIMHHQIVLDELARSLGNLSPQQSFAVIYFQANNAVEVPPAGRFAPATNQNRTAAIEWIKKNVVPAGGTNPLVAIDKALALKPDVIFLLSQDITGYGQFEVDLEELMSRLDQRNPKNPETGRRLTQINCIQFVSEDRLKAMERIAREHGGPPPNGFKFLSSEELGLGKQ